MRRRSGLGGSGWWSRETTWGARRPPRRRPWCGGWSRGCAVREGERGRAYAGGRGNARLCAGWKRVSTHGEEGGADAAVSAGVGASVGMGVGVRVGERADRRTRARVCCPAKMYISVRSSSGRNSKLAIDGCAGSVGVGADIQSRECGVRRPGGDIATAFLVYAPTRLGRLRTVVAVISASG